MELRQHRRVDFVGLDLCPGNGSNQDRIGDDDPTDEEREQTDNHVRIAGRLNDDLVIGLERLGELQQATVLEIYPSRIPNFTIFQNGLERMSDGRREQRFLISRLLPGSNDQQEPAGLHDNYGSALAAQPGKSKGAAR